MEIEAYAAAILAARGEEGRMDRAPIWSGIGDFNGRPWRGRVDCIIGGFPCTDISSAGKQAGFIDADGNVTRSGLWFEYARIIDEVRPRFVFIENVAQLANRGLDVVLRALAEMGFDAEFGVYSAAEAGAPHKRERIFILAWRRMGDASSERERESNHETEAERDGRPWTREDASGSSERPPVANTDCEFDQRRRTTNDVACLASHPEGQGDQRQWSRDASDDREQTLADDDDDGREGERGGGVRNVCAGRPEDPECGRDPNGPSGSPPLMGHHHHPGLEGRGVQGCERPDEVPPWPPGPEDQLGWREYLAVYPGLAPSVASSKRSVRGSAHGVADRPHGAVCLCNRIDRLRACGNGVVPEQAALALRDLAARAGVKVLAALGLG